MSSPSSNIQNGRALYRILMQTIRQLPQNSQNHYKHSVRQAFNSHADEDDPERLRQIYGQAIKDAEWLRNKYKLKKEAAAEHSLLKK